MRLRFDFFAALAVTIIAVPMSLGLAHASGLPPLAGLIGGIIGGLVVPLISGAPLAIFGPAAGGVVLTASALAYLPSRAAFATTVMLSGLIQLAMSRGHVGRSSRLLPSAVIRGASFAIGLILILKQLPHLVGYDAEDEGVMEMGADLINVARSTFDQFSPAAFGLGISSLLFMMLWHRKLEDRTRVPSVLFGLLVGTAACMLLDKLVPQATVGPAHHISLPAWSDVFVFPDPKALFSLQVWGFALLLAVATSLESLVATDLVDALHKEQHRSDSNRVLFAQGVANLCSGVIGGLPLAGNVVTSSVNASVGARTKNAALMHGALLVFATVALSPLFGNVPIAVVAAALIHIGLRLSKPRFLVEMRGKRIEQWLPFAFTIVTAVFSNLSFGVIVGIAATTYFVLRTSYDTPAFELHDYGRIKEIQLGEQVLFLHKPRLAKLLESLPDDCMVEFNGSKCHYIDPEVLELIEDYRERATAAGTVVIVGGIANLAQPQEFLQKMSDEYHKLIENNRTWVEQRLKENPNYFADSAKGQTPSFLFIGCSDSRVPVNTITRTDPGDIFVHRNIANVVSLSDINLLSVVQYSVDVLNVRHIIVCGHYGCGGVKAAISNRSFGLIDNWIQPIKLVIEKHQAELSLIKDENLYERRVVELHVVEQVRNLMKTSLVQNTIAKYGFPHLHGWAYDLDRGLINDLKVEMTMERDLNTVYRYK